MARAYHNLKGLLRDLEHATSAGDYTDVWYLLDLLDAADDLHHGDADVLDAEEPAGGGFDAQVELPYTRDSAPVCGPTPGHDPGGETPLAPATSGLESEMVRRGQARARALARQALPRNSGPLARTAILMSRESRNGKAS